MVICNCERKKQNYLDKMEIECDSCKNIFHSECANMSKLKQAQIYCNSYGFICNDCRHKLLIQKYFGNNPEILAYDELNKTFGRSWHNEFERK